MEIFEEELKALLKKYNKEIKVSIQPIIVDGQVVTREVNVEVPEDSQVGYECPGCGSRFSKRKVKMVCDCGVALKKYENN